MAANNRIISFIEQHLWWMLLLFIFLLQIPFLNADPDIQLSISRDAHTDEGLNSIQIRNYVNHGYLNPWECDNLMKNPLYNLLLFIPFKIFGTHLMVGRLTILFFTLGVFLFIGLDKKWRRWIWFALVPVFTQYHIFHYSHYVMAEMMAISCIVLGLYGIVKMWDEEKLKRKIGWLFLGTTGFMFAWYMKIQFIYVLAIYGMIILIYLILNTYKYGKLNKEIFIVLVASIVFSAFFIGFYYFVWYGHFKEAYDYIMQHQTGNRFAQSKYFWDSVGENLRRYMYSNYLKFSFIVVAISIPIGLWLMFKVKGKLFKRIWLVTFVWFLVELHKLALHHLPSRYFVSMIVCMMLLAGSTLLGLCYYVMENDKPIGKMVYQGFMFLLASMVALNLGFYGQSMARRTFAIQEISRYMQSFSDKELVVIGAWSPTITWNTKYRALPVWKDFLNYQNIKETYHPDVIITEPDENDSDGAYLADGYDIVAESDSMKQIKIGRWDLEIYWMKK